MFCRTMFCETCAIKAQPQVGQSFVVYGHTEKKLKVYHHRGGIQKSNYGFTPHLIEIIKEASGEIVLEVSCGVCSHDIAPMKTKENCFKVTCLKAHYVRMTKDSFYHFYNMPDLGYHIY